MRRTPHDATPTSVEGPKSRRRRVPPRRRRPDVPPGGKKARRRLAAVVLAALSLLNGPTTTTMAAKPTATIDVHSSSANLDDTKLYGFHVTEAKFGPDLPFGSSSALFRVASPPSDDPLLCDEADGDADYANNPPADSPIVSGGTMLIPRGGCNFERKVLSAQRLGASSAIVYNNLGSRYSMLPRTVNGTAETDLNEYNDDEYDEQTFDDIVWPKAKNDYECSNGRGYVPLESLSFDPLPYHSDVNDPVLTGTGSDGNLCALNAEAEGYDFEDSCPSLRCLLTGRKDADGRAMEACCAWDVHVQMNSDSTLSDDPSERVTIPSVFASMVQGEELLATLNEHGSDASGGSGMGVSMYQRWHPTVNASSFLLWLLGTAVTAAASWMSAKELRGTTKLVDDAVRVGARRRAAAAAAAVDEEEALDPTSAAATGGGGRNGGDEDGGGGGGTADGFHVANGEGDIDDDRADDDARRPARDPDAVAAEGERRAKERTAAGDDAEFTLAAEQEPSANREGATDSPGNGDSSASSSSANWTMVQRTAEGNAREERTTTTMTTNGDETTPIRGSSPPPSAAATSNESIVDHIPAEQFRPQQQPQQQQQPPPPQSLELNVYHALFFLVFASAGLFVLFFFKIYKVVTVLYGLGCSGAVSQVVFHPLYSFVARKTNHTQTVRTSVCPKITKCGLNEVTYLDALAIVSGYATGISWLVVGFTTHDPSSNPFYWITQDVMGASICIVFLGLIHLNSIKIASVLLVAAFVYDIFFVFLTPYIFDGDSIMITVATSGGPPEADADYCEKYPDDKDCEGGDPLPMLLTIPRIGDYRGGSSLLGLGDIVLPGLLISFASRLDESKSLVAACSSAAAAVAAAASGRAIPTGASDRTRAAMTGDGPSSRYFARRRFFARVGGLFRGRYFAHSVVAYAIGLMFANVAVYLMKKGQPALLYLVPTCLGTVVFLGRRRRELKELWSGHPAIRTADGVARRVRGAGRGGVPVDRLLRDAGGDDATVGTVDDETAIAGAAMAGEATGMDVAASREGSLADPSRPLTRSIT